MLLNNYTPRNPLSKQHNFNSHWSSSKPWCNAATINVRIILIFLLLFAIVFFASARNPQQSEASSHLFSGGCQTKAGKAGWRTPGTPQDSTTTLHHKISASQKALNITHLTMWGDLRSDILLKAVKFCKTLLCTHWNLAAAQHGRSDSRLNNSFSVVSGSGWILFVGWLEIVH